ncbi:nitroreductase family protein [Parabacteroides sp. AM08-6]|uniref:nitroreductase family protein n=1 Tax=Parabacteroides sp. AM08-6 TaxID=2292053 RepID=UPI000EFDCE95|nr:nitroreductase family protein [Parabacteroides sp. AM08-6]RHJ78096.1 NAD(P)H nitroreductase [Parabacteroides sp. AM08-6]
MESFATLIKTRRSTRKFTDRLLNPEQVEMILRAALMAPASKRSNPWQFVVVEDKEMLAKLATCKKAGSAFLEGCALAVVVLANVMESDVWVEDASVASIYMQLQAEDLGLGSCWCQIRNRFTADDTDANQYVRDLLNIPYQLDVLSIIGFGYKDQERKPFDEAHLQWEKVHLGAYSAPEGNKAGEEA